MAVRLRGNGSFIVHALGGDERGGCVHSVGLGNIRLARPHFSRTSLVGNKRLILRVRPWAGLAVGQLL